MYVACGMCVRDVVGIKVKVKVKQSLYKTCLHLCLSKVFSNFVTSVAGPTHVKNVLAEPPDFRIR
jgi:hypothetical protein